VADDDLSDVPEPEEPPTEWLNTFADMSCLLMTFFVLLFSMSTIDPKKFTDSFTVVKQVFGGKEKELSTAKVKQEEASILDTVRMQKQLIESQRKVFSDVKTFMNRKGVEGVIGAVFDEGIITLRVPGNALFPSSEVELTPKGKEALSIVRELLIKSPDQTVNIVGHTDDIPPAPGSRFKDNWEISALRAVNVLRFFIQSGIDPKRLTATGLADLQPLFPNTSEENRAQNRRVDIVLQKKVGK
jgi:chemotaxis protein MotB